MNRSKLYFKTVDTLLDAYNNKTLRHGDCKACAVGNICGGHEWAYIFHSTFFFNETDGLIYDLKQIDDISHFCFPEEIKRAEELIKSTGYTVAELKSIEWAFESAERGRLTRDSLKTDPTWMYNGLCAVLDVLKQIHEVDKQTHEEKATRLSEIREFIEA